MASSPACASPGSAPRAPALALRGAPRNQRAAAAAFPRDASAGGPRRGGSGAAPSGGRGAGRLEAAGERGAGGPRGPGERAAGPGPGERGGDAAPSRAGVAAMFAGLQDLGVANGEDLKETLTNCTEPLKAIEQFQVRAWAGGGPGR